MSIFSKFFSNTHTESTKKFEPIVAQINALEVDIQKLTDQQLKEKTVEFKNKIQNSKFKIQNEKNEEEENKLLGEILPEAFALVREASRRTLGQRHFDV